jgi:hypothetical protein
LNKALQEDTLIYQNQDIIVPPSREDSLNASKYINEMCSEDSECYSGICANKASWTKTCQGRPYGDYCTSHSKHCMNGHICLNNSCGPLLNGVECDGLNDYRCQGGTTCQYDITKKNQDNYICSLNPAHTNWIRFGTKSIDKNSENCNTESYNNAYSCRDILNIYNTVDSILNGDEQVKNKLTDDEYNIIKNRLQDYGYVDRCREVCK